MVTWLTDSLNMWTRPCVQPFSGWSQSFGNWSLGNSWRPISGGISSPLFSWDFLKFKSPTINTGGATWNSSFGVSNYNMSSNPFCLGCSTQSAWGTYQAPSLNIPSFSNFLNLTYTPSSSSTWANLGLNLSTSTSSSIGVSAGNSSQSGAALTCSTQNINSKNAPYNGYDKSPHSAVNSNVNNYTKYGNNKHIAQLEPEFQLKIMKIIDYAKQHGYDFKIISSFRTRSHQDRLRKKYANQKGRAAKVSPHMFGKAIDFQVLKNGRKCSAGYDLVGKYAESLGIRWGARFQTCKERWHFDYNWA